MQILRTTQDLADQYRFWHQDQNREETEETVSVDEVAARVASFYERIRGVVDWREEHLLRRTAIERILRRRLLTTRNLVAEEEMALPFVQELVRGGHFPNASIPLSRVRKVQDTIRKYVVLAERAKSGNTKNANGRDVSWLFRIAACEIEEVLAPPIREASLMNFTRARIEERLTIKERDSWNLTGEESSIQIEIAVYRALFGLDEAAITLALIERFYPDWRNPSAITLEELARSLPSFRERLGRLLDHPLAERFYRLVERHDAPYLILGDVMSLYAERFVEVAEQDAGSIEVAARAAYKARLGRLRARTKRAGLYSTISIFLTKIVFVLALEIPLERYLGGGSDSIALAFSVLVPALFMFILASSVIMTTVENEQRVILQLMRQIYAGQQPEAYALKLPRRRLTPLKLAVDGFYLLSFFLSYGAIAWGLRGLAFGWPSIAVFLLFLSLVAYAGTKIRQRGRELLVVDAPYGILEAIFDLFALPLVHVGKWLSRQIARYNVLILFLNFLVEIPFQVFVEFLEQWRAFLKEKRDEIH